MDKTKYDNEISKLRGKIAAWGEVRNTAEEQVRSLQEEIDSLQDRYLASMASSQQTT